MKNPINNIDNKWVTKTLSNRKKEGESYEANVVKVI